MSLQIVNDYHTFMCQEIEIIDAELAEIGQNKLHSLGAFRRCGFKQLDGVKVTGRPLNRTYFFDCRYFEESFLTFMSMSSLLP